MATLAAFLYVSVTKKDFAAVEVVSFTDDIPQSLPWSVNVSQSAPTWMNIVALLLLNTHHHYCFCCCLFFTSLIFGGITFYHLVLTH